jgi:hypothetical protein
MAMLAKKEITGKMPVPRTAQGILASGRSRRRNPEYGNDTAGAPQAKQVTSYSSYWKVKPLGPIVKLCSFK